MAKAYDPIKVQYELLKVKSGQVRHADEKWLGYKYGRIAGDVWILPNDYMAYVIPEEDFYLDLDKVFDDKTEFNVEWLYKESQQAEGAYYAGDTHVKRDGITKRVEVYRRSEGSKASVWVDPQLTKAFTLNACTYGMIDSKKPLFIYDKESMRLIGAVLPIAHKEEDSGEHQSDD